jgi:type IX secretion system PorP/SprF family membrane protein
MKKLITFLLLYTACCTLTHAQQLSQYSLYMFNPYGYNPAYAGLENTLIANGVYRKQWTNLRGAPETQHFNLHLPVAIIRSGVGLKLENDRIGAHRTTQAMLSYNYQLEIGRTALLAVGIGGGYLQYSLDGDKLRAPEGEYAEPSNFTHNDQLLPLGKVQAGAPIFEAGVYFLLNRFEAGVSVQPAFAPRLTASGSGFALQPERHYVFYAAQQLGLSDALMLRPSVLVKSDGVETQYEISATARWQENIFVGGSFRGFTATTRDAAVVFGGLKLNEKVTVGYAYDVPLSALNAVNRGSHEILLRYSLNRPIGNGKLPPVIYNPRFF